jgi:hypothetical protein
VEGGFLIPVEAADYYVDPDADTAEVEEDSPTEDWKNADIEAWAEDHHVDLAGATKKADMLAAISAASNKEG